jgi:hypothetical protein
MMFTMIVVTALMAGAGVLISLQLSSTRTTEITRTRVTGQGCAEAGVTSARAVLPANYASWASALAACGAGPYPCAEPAWLYAAIGSHDLDGDLVDDFEVYIKDDDDEISGPNDPTVDSNLRVFVVSRCIKYPDNPISVSELVVMSAGGTSYTSQQGGGTGNGNSN